MDMQNQIFGLNFAFKTYNKESETDREEFIPQSFQIEHTFYLTKNSHKQLLANGQFSERVQKFLGIKHKTSAKYLLYLKKPMP